MSRINATSVGILLAASIATAAPARDQGPATKLSAVAAVEGHCAAWNTTDHAKRDLLLKQVFAEDGVYSDPTPTFVTGRAALSKEIASFQRQYPGARFRCSAPQAHHSALRVSWLLLRPDGTVLTQGMDFYELAPNGLIRRVTGFFGPPPEVSPIRIVHP